MISKREEEADRISASIASKANELRGTIAVTQDVIRERQAQNEKWGIQHHDGYKWLAILSEEVGESAQELLTETFGESGKGHGNLREELIHSAAVLVAWIEDIDSRENV